MRPRIREARRALIARALADGPAALDGRARRTLLVDPEATSALHHAVWELEDAERARAWGRPGMPPAA
jgi:membrane glycosyltransferase